MHLFISYLLPLFYFALLAFLLQRNKYLLGNGFSRLFIILFFTAKCLTGMFADYLSLFYTSDIRLYFKDGLELYQTLLHNPSAFINLLQQKFAIQNFDLFNSHSGFIQAVFESIKFIQFILNLFSGGNLYTNTILFNGLATILLLRFWIFLKKYTSGWMAGAWIILMPSAFFYTSNMLKEALAGILLAVLIPLAYKLYKTIRLKNVVAFLVLFCFLFFFKFLVAVTFGYAILIWWLLSKFYRHKAVVLINVATIGIVVFFLSKYLHPVLDFPAYVVQRQAEFLALKAHSIMKVQIPEPTFTGFLKALPSAASNVLFKPLPGEGGQFFYFIHTIEIYAFWGFIIYLGLKNRFKIQPNLVQPLFWAMLLYAIINLLIIGYIVPNIGALVRYRSIFLPWIGVFFRYLFNGNERLAYLGRLLPPGEPK